MQHYVRIVYRTDVLVPPKRRGKKDVPATTQSDVAVPVQPTTPTQSASTTMAAAPAQRPQSEGGGTITTAPSSDSFHEKAMPQSMPVNGYGTAIHAQQGENTLDLVDSQAYPGFDMQYMGIMAGSNDPVRLEWSCTIYSIG